MHQSVVLDVFLKIIDDQDQELELTRDGCRSPISEKYQWRNWATDPEGITGQALFDFINDELFPTLKGLRLTGKPGDRRRVVREVFEDAYNYVKSGQLLRQVVNKINDVDFNLRTAYCLFSFGGESGIFSGMSQDLPPIAVHPTGEQSAVALGGAAAAPPPLVVDSFAGSVRIEWDHATAFTPLGQLPFFI
ncbi:MAG: hypothetical protein WAV18_08535, partial [Roseiarcus sp.]